MASYTLVFFVFATFAAAHAGRVSPVQKVLSLIEDFATKVQKDVDVAAKQFGESAKLCDEESVARGYAIKDTEAQIETLSAAIESENAKLVEFATNIQDASGRISGTEGELYKANEQRETTRKDFVSNEKELLNTVGQLEGATTSLKKALALAQVTPEAKKKVERVVGALSQIVEASFVTHAQRAKVKAFLQSRSEADDDLSLVAANKGSDGNGGGIVETLEQMTDKAEGTLSDARKGEMQSNHEFMMLKQGMESEIKSTNQELAENKNGKQISTQTLAQAEKDLGIAKRALAEDTAYVAELKRDCMEKAQTWEVNHKDGEAELKALSSAKEILTKKFKAAFIESKVKLKVKAYARSQNDDSKAKALRLIDQLGHKFHSTALIALAYSASSDPFEKIRGMVEDMIKKLQQQAAEEATQKAFCDQEMAESKQKKDIKEGKLETVDARIEKAESTIATLSEQIATLSSEIAEIDSAVKVGTDLRQAENAAFRVAEKDFDESQTACAQAIEVLREYYEGAGAALVQLGSSSLDGSGIISILELAESDFSKMLAESRTAENAAAHEFKKMLQENKLAKATKEAEQKGKESEVKMLKAALANSSEDKEGLASELDAVMQYINELRPQCETKVSSYAEVKAKREQEIEGLKEALEILRE